MRELLRDAPMPTRAVGRVPKYPFASMAVGDSFIVDANEVGAVKNAAYRWRERHMPWMFIVGQDEAGQTRLWRIRGKQKRIKGR